MKLLIKLGGTLLEEKASRHNLARQLAALGKEHEIVVVHGGGKQVTQFLEARGVVSRFANGLRVSDEPVIDAVLKVIAGTVNKQLVASLIAAGRLAVGLSGVDGSLTYASQLDPALHFVGKPEQTDARLLDLLMGGGYTPVVACVAGDANGAVYNVNADQMAVSCALGWRANTLIFLTDVVGVRNENAETLTELDVAGARELIRIGAAHGGMRAKLEAAILALREGLDEVVIASGHEPDVCGRLLRREVVGTRLCAEAPVGEGQHA